MTDGNSIRLARQRKGWSQAELAERVGTKQQTIQKLERGTVTFSRYLPEICAQLDLNGNNQQPAVLAPSQQMLVGDVDLPVYGSVQGGEGAIIMSSEPVDYVRRPAPLAQVKDGYAILVIGESMVPAFEPGDTVLIHPHLPPIRDCDVVLYGRDDQGHEVVTIKRLTRITATDWHLHQWNPPNGRKADFSLPRRLWPKCHRIVGKYSRR